VASKADSKLAWSESRTFSLTQPAAPAPTLIASEDGAVFYRETPTFIWRSNPLEPDYVIRIFTDTTIVLQDTLSDTSYVMSVSVFDILENGTYDWWVGTVIHNELIVSGTRTFKIIGPVDLDTTYFPFGLGYEWCYESNNGGVYDTFTVEVTDSSWIADTLVFQLIGSFYGISNPVEIWDNQVTVFDELIDVVPQACTLINEPLKFYVISYRSDILWITVYYPWGEDPDGFAECWTTHERGIGARKQERTNWSGGGPVSGFTYTLLTMTTPEGQRYP
jgi:hypothetical protein